MNCDICGFSYPSEKIVITLCSYENSDEYYWFCNECISKMSETCRSEYSVVVTLVFDRNTSRSVVDGYARSIY